jgi:acylphosphatase
MSENIMAQKIRLHATIHGYVQGVSFRYYTFKQATSLGAVGWVRNLWDGRVEVVAEGERGALDQLLAWLRRGPPAAEVEAVDVQWETPTGKFRQFEVRV